MRNQTQKLAPAEPEAAELYRMSTATRLLVYSPRFTVMVALVAGLYLAVIPHLAWPLRALFALVTLLAALALYASRSQTSSLVVRARLEDSEIHFTRWDRKELVVPRRGRALKKDTSSRSALLLLQPTAGGDSVSLLKQDKDAMALLADLDRRGVVRGPGAPRDRSPLTGRP
jgi:hypothetical protein